MKRLLSIIILMLALAGLAQAAANVTLAWDPMPAGQAWTAVRAYERTGAIGSYVYTLVGTSTGSPPAPTVTIPNVSVGTHTYVVRAYNGQSESVDSNAVQGIILSVPTAPVTVTITVTVQ